MRTAPAKSKGREVLSDVVFGLCKDFLCPPQTKIQEWFPTEIQARLRAQALDPYGYMLESNNGLKKFSGYISYRCQNENCHAKVFLKKVSPDPEGNFYGLYGCKAKHLILMSLHL